MRSVIYARYSTDLQREASIEDQVRICAKRIAQEGWQLSATYSDAASSGTRRLRPGYQKLLEDTRNGVSMSWWPRPLIGFPATRRMWRLSSSSFASTESA